MASSCLSFILKVCLKAYISFVKLIFKSLTDMLNYPAFALNNSQIALLDWARSFRRTNESQLCF